jgi:hypothetical protein
MNPPVTCYPNSYGDDLENLVSDLEGLWPSQSEGNPTGIP